LGWHKKEEIMTTRYDAAFKKSIEDPNGFWGEAGENVHWYKEVGQGFG
jgi:hypothetical protein